MSKNGTFVNGERIHGRRRLGDDDRVRVGRTLLQYKVPGLQPALRTLTDEAMAFSGEISSKRRRVLIALCRPRVVANKALTASNQDIADECDLPTLDAVKQQLTSLYRDFQIDDLPQREKRNQLAELAIHHGIVGSATTPDAGEVNPHPGERAGGVSRPRIGRTPTRRDGCPVQRWRWPPP